GTGGEGTPGAAGERLTQAVIRLMARRTGPCAISSSTAARVPEVHAPSNQHQRLKTRSSNSHSGTPSKRAVIGTRLSDRAWASAAAASRPPEALLVDRGPLRL